MKNNVVLWIAAISVVISGCAKDIMRMENDHYIVTAVRYNGGATTAFTTTVYVTNKFVEKFDRRPVLGLTSDTVVASFVSEHIVAIDRGPTALGLPNEYFLINLSAHKAPTVWVDHWRVYEPGIPDSTPYATYTDSTYSVRFHSTSPPSCVKKVTLSDHANEILERVIYLSPVDSVQGKFYGNRLFGLIVKWQHLSEPWSFLITMPTTEHEDIRFHFQDELEEGSDVDRHLK